MIYKEIDVYFFELLLAERGPSLVEYMTEERSDARIGEMGWIDRSLPLPSLLLRLLLLLLLGVDIFDLGLDNLNA